MESKYRFNPERCKAAIEGLSKMVYDNGYTAIPTRDKVLLGVILDDLILDIEALHSAATERDEVLEAMLEEATTPYNDYDYCAMEDQLLRLYHCYTNEDGVLEEIQPLEL